MKKWVVLGAAVVVLYSAGGHPGMPAKSGTTAAKAIAYARGQLGKPYLWGGTGPGAFDCSGLVQQAYAHAGIRIARRSQEQWATEPHVTSPQPGDLVFFAGADGTATDPGHVGLVIGGGKMIEAYGKGFPVRVASYAGRGAIGFTEPGAGAGSPPPPAGGTPIRVGGA